jgi:hypothetical protein
MQQKLAVADNFANHFLFNRKAAEGKLVRTRMHPFTLGGGFFVFFRFYWNL